MRGVGEAVFFREGIEFHAIIAEFRHQSCESPFSFVLAERRSHHGSEEPHEERDADVAGASGFGEAYSPAGVILDESEGGRDSLRSFA